MIKQLGTQVAEVETGASKVLQATVAQNCNRDIIIQGHHSLPVAFLHGGG
jgi:hypothetical protein